MRTCQPTTPRITVADPTMIRVTPSGQASIIRIMATGTRRRRRVSA